MFEKQKNKNELMTMLNAESLKVENFDDVITKDSISFPLADMAALGASVASMVGIISSAGQSAGNGKLYRAIIPKGWTLNSAKDGSGLLGSIRKTSGGSGVGQARFREVKDASKVASGASSAAMMCMAIAIMAINQSLKNISENQKNILTFLETDKQTQLKGDLLILSEIINDYQYNWDNTQFKSNRETQVLNIKRSAEQNILFYREMIEKKLSKQSFIQKRINHDGIIQE